MKSVRLSWMYGMSQSLLESTSDEFRKEFEKLPFKKEQFILNIGKDVQNVDVDSTH